MKNKQFFRQLNKLHPPFEIQKVLEDRGIDLEGIEKFFEKRSLEKAIAPESQRRIRKRAISTAINKWKRHETDVGSMEVQVAVLQEKIKPLLTHILANKHDMPAKRTMSLLIGKRKRCLDYLYQTNRTALGKILSTYGIVYKTAFEQKYFRVNKYALFRNTKSKSMLKRREGKKKKKLLESQASELKDKLQQMGEVNSKQERIEKGRLTKKLKKNKREMLDVKKMK